ncbi:hypothetical protein PTSG_08823 [Salpingoeca rosetta]|uniref:W2 domain-containing protein n=1 Tax=Salpingoeca rosetta (strain ATCC 50818 / BSB-021) TaxID=946362 RepID=F2UKT3_SALR5|nr:uncharacterized protein PTSG_08823 [Salpingoeca rosetta]EGD77732.1 hypothetical protein PTSG_08823 [Salpingoeca rosetta]|eukprot:XP_004990208.1 hypothetical protein PTSG_08823 [Salpingoeca rosetta]
MSTTGHSKMTMNVSEMSEAIRRLSDDTSATDRLSSILNNVVSKEDFNEAAIQELVGIILEHRRVKGSTNNKCVRSLCYASRDHTERLVLLSPLLTRLITLDERNQKRNGSMFLRGQRNFLACLERLYARESFSGDKAQCLTQLLYTQLQAGGLEGEVVLNWIKRQQPLTDIPQTAFAALRQQLLPFQDWLSSSLETDDEDATADH